MQREVAVRSMLVGSKGTALCLWLRDVRPTRIVSLGSGKNEHIMRFLRVSLNLGQKLPYLSLFPRNTNSNLHRHNGINEL